MGLTFNNVLTPISGAYEVSEAFAEVSIPILANLPLVDSLSIDGAGRYSHYSTVGDTSTWKFGAEWAPIHDVRFRYTRSKAVRAPNIEELFDPGGQDFEFIDDPCDPLFINQGTASRAANCAAILTAAGANPATYADPNVGVNIAGTQKGNPNLEPETAQTTTLGVVVAPRFIKSLIFSVDYYSINLSNAINLLTPQDMADQCVDLPTTANEFCPLIIRQVGGVDAGGIIDFTRQPVNVAQFNSRGFDLSLSYLFDPANFGIKQDLGTIGFRLIANHLDKLTFVNLPGVAAESDRGELGAPTWQGIWMPSGRVGLGLSITPSSTTARRCVTRRRPQPSLG